MQAVPGRVWVWVWGVAVVRRSGFRQGLVCRAFRPGTLVVLGLVWAWAVAVVHRSGFRRDLVLRVSPRETHRFPVVVPGWVFRLGTLVVLGRV